MERRTFHKLAGAAAFAAAAQSGEIPLPRETMELATTRFRIDLQSLLNPYDMQWIGKLPGHWYDGAPLGNGDMGVLVYGFPENLCFVISKGDVWDRRNERENDFPGADYKTFRQTYFDGDWAAHQRMQAEAASKRRNRTLALPHMTGCGRITLHLDGGMQAANCRMRVRLHDGVMQLNYAGRTVLALVSRKHQVLMVDIDRGAAEQDPPDPVLANRYGSLAPFEELPWEMWRPALEGNPRAQASSRDGFDFLTQKFSAGGEYTLGVAFSSFKSADHRTLTGRIAGSLAGIDGRHCRMYVAVVSSADTGDTAGECYRRLQRAIAAGPAAIMRDHHQWWQDYWMRGLASVGDKAVEKWYYRSLYLCGATLEPRRQSPGLQGVWVGENFPRWCADFHSNVNIQCLYWGLLANNRLDLTEPYLAHYQRTADVARAVARDYYKMRGLRFPHMGSLAGHEMAPPNMLGVDVGGTGWLVQLFWQFYLYTGAKDFLRDVAYPLLRDAALLYSDIMTRDSKTGKWTIAPVVHFEARVYSADERPKVTPPFDMWSVNSGYAQAMFRLTFDQAIRAAEILGVDDGYRREWREKVSNMVPPPVTPEGWWKQWENQDPVYGWHNFSLALVFPAELVSRWHGPAEWREQAQRTWRHLKSSPKKTGTGSAWCGGQGLCELIRIGAAEDALAGARWRDDEPENGFVVQYDGALIQVDHGPGMCRVLADMCVLGLDGVVHLFPGIPKNMPARCFSLRVPGGFLITAEKRAEMVDYVIVKATSDSVLRMEDPWSGKLIEQRMASDSVRLFTRPGLDAASLSVETFGLNAG